MPSRILLSSSTAIALRLPRQLVGGGDPTPDALVQLQRETPLILDADVASAAEIVLSLGSVAAIGPRVELHVQIIGHFQTI